MIVCVQVSNDLVAIVELVLTMMTVHIVHRSLFQRREYGGYIYMYSLYTRIRTFHVCIYRKWEEEEEEEEEE